MATNLLGTNPKSTYKDLLHLANSNGGLDATIRALYSGNGVASPLQMSTTLVNINGKLGVGTPAPTALLHLAAGTAVEGTAPLKFTDGALNTTSEAGTLEFYDGHFYFSKAINVRYVPVMSNGVKTTTTTVSNTVVETSFYSKTFVANELHEDEVIDFELSGVYSNDSASDDFTINYYLGGSLIASTTRAAGNVTNQGWKASFKLTTRTAGASGKFVHSHEYDDTVTHEIHGNIIEIDIDTTTPTTFEAKIQWDNQKTGNTFSCTQGYVQLNH